MSFKWTCHSNKYKKYNRLSSKYSSKQIYLLPISTSNILYQHRPINKHPFRSPHMHTFNPIIYRQEVQSVNRFTNTPKTPNSPKPTHPPFKTNPTTHRIIQRPKSTHSSGPGIVSREFIGHPTISGTLVLRTSLPSGSSQVTNKIKTNLRGIRRDQSICTTLYIIQHIQPPVGTRRGWSTNNTIRYFRYFYLWYVLFERWAPERFCASIAFTHYKYALYNRMINFVN